MATTRKRPRRARAGSTSGNGSKVMDAATELERAHERMKDLRVELRSAEGDVRRAVSHLKRLTAPKTAPRRAPVFRPYRPPAAPSGE